MTQWAMPWQVAVGGQVMTARWNPVLISIETTDNAGAESDTAELVFDNTNGQVLFPEKGTPIQIGIGGEPCFDGYTDEPRSSGGRGQGRQFSVSCKSFDPKGKVKQRLDFHKDDATLKQFLQEAARRAGIASVHVDETLGAIRRPYWNPLGRSFFHLGEMLAQELGATFKLSGARAALVKRGQGQTATGKQLPTIRAVWGDNLINWNITPDSGRQQSRKTRLSWFDRKEAKWKEEDVEIRGGENAPAATDRPALAVPDAAAAKDRAGGRKTEDERSKGSGSVEIDCDPRARAECTLELAGADPGVDGTYRIETATHKLDRSGGSVTTLSVKQPQGEAGKDGRRKQNPSGSPAGAATSGSAAP